MQNEEMLESRFSMEKQRENGERRKENILPTRLFTARQFPQLLDTLLGPMEAIFSLHLD